MKAVQLQVYRGSKILYNENREIDNENQSVKLTHGILEWYNYMKEIPSMGYCKVEVKKVIDLDTGKEIDLKKEEEIILEVKNAHEFKKAENLSPEQKEIRELKEQINAMVNPKKVEKPVNDNLGLEDARQKYFDAFGEKPHHRLSIEGINEKIASNVK